MHSRSHTAPFSVPGSQGSVLTRITKGSGYFETIPGGYEDSWPFLLSKKEGKNIQKVRGPSVAGLNTFFKFYVEVDSFPIRFPECSFSL